MTDFPDASGNQNILVLNGTSQVVEAVKDKNFTFKSAIVPTGANARRNGDNFGSIISYGANELIVGTPNHPFDSAGSNSLSNAGSAWIFEKVTTLKSKTTRVKTHQKIEFAATGAVIPFTVPDGVGEITLNLWGAAGGGESTGAHRGGNGGFTRATILVNAGHTYNLIIGKGGVLAGTTSAFGGGGYFTATGALGGSGGGRTAFADPLLGDMIVAGGGGGAGADGNGGDGGGQTGGNGTTRKIASGLANDSRVDATGGSRATQGLNTAIDNPNFILYGANVSKAALNAINYWDVKSQGGNASANNGNYSNGCGGGGYAGGAAGLSAWGYQPQIGGGIAGNANPIGGSGAGGSGNIELNPAFMPIPTEVEAIKRAYMAQGGEAAFANELAGYGIGGVGSTPGTDGHILIEWDEYSEVETSDETWNWKQTGRLVPTGRSAGQLFGSTVAIFGDWAFVGSPTDSTSKGTVWAFQKVAGAWVQKQAIIATGTNARNNNDLFGSSIQFTGDTLYVGAPGHGYDATGANLVATAGATFVFTLSGSSWNLRDKIVAVGTSSRIAGDNFGYRISASGSTVAISSRNTYDDNGVAGLTNRGSVFVYDYDLGYNPSARIVGPQYLQGLFGNALDLNDDILAIESSAGSSRRVYKRLPTGVWSLNTAIIDSTDDGVIMASTGKNMTLVANQNTSLPLGRLNETNTTHLFESDFLQYRTTKLFTASRNWTMEYWVYVVAPITSVLNQNDDALMISRYLSWSVNAHVGSFETGAPVLRFDINKQGGFASFETAPFALKAWTHVAWVRDGDEFRTYTNGRLSNTYDITTFDFDEYAQDIFFGKNATYIGTTTTIPHSLRDFSISSKSKYKNDFVPNQWAATAKAPNSNGRGTSTYVMDSSTILSGLPNAYSDENVLYDTTVDRDSTTYRSETSLPQSGRIEVLRDVGDTFTKIDQSLIAPGIYSTRKGSGFGTSITTDGRFLSVSSQNDDYGLHNGHYMLYNKGSAWVYDLTDFSFVKKIVPRKRQQDYLWYNGLTLDNIYYPSFFGAFSDIDKDQNFKLADANFRTTEQVYTNIDTFSVATTGTGSNITNYWRPTNTKTVFFWTASGRITSVSDTSGTINTTGEQLLNRRAITGGRLTATLNGTATTVGTVNAILNTGVASYSYLTFGANIDNGITYDATNTLFTHDDNGVGKSTIWGDLANTGNVTRYVLNPATNVYDGVQLDQVGLAGTNPRGFAELFGTKVKTDGTRVYVGSPSSSWTPYTNNQNDGSFGRIDTFVYDTVNVGWNTLNTIYNPDGLTTPSKSFGFAFDAFGDTLVAKYVDANNKVYTYTMNGTEWVLGQTLTGSATDYGAKDSIAFVGSETNFVNGSPNFAPGTLRDNVGRIDSYTSTNGIFARDSIDFTLRFAVPYRAASQFFGQSVAIEGTKIAIGVPGIAYTSDGVTALLNGVTPQRVGAAKIYDFTNTSWIYVVALQDNSNATIAGFGTRVSMKSGVVAVKNSLTDTAGRVGIYEYANNAWTYANTIVGSGTTISAEVFGAGHVVLGESTRALGTITPGSFTSAIKTNTTYAGTGNHIFVPLTTNGAYDYNSVKVGNYENTYAGRNAGDLFGTSVKISTDKQMLLVGAIGHQYASDPTSRPAQTNAGAVFTYYWDTLTSQWKLNTKLNDTAVRAGSYGLEINAAGAGSYVVSGNVSASLQGSINKITQNGTGITASWTSGPSVDSTVANDGFGADVAYDATRDVYYVGADTRTDAPFASGGFEAVTLDATPIVRTPYVDSGVLNNRNANDNFGYSVSLRGEHLAVGVPGYDWNTPGTVSKSNQGAAFVFSLEEGLFGPFTKLTMEDQLTSAYGSMVGLSDTALYVQGSGVNPVVYTLNGNTYTPANVVTNSAFTITDSVTPNKFAFDPATNNAVLGAKTGTFNNANVLTTFGGVVGVTNDGSTWTVSSGTQAQNVNAMGTSVSSHAISGSIAAGYGQNGVALNTDGSMLAIAAPADTYMLGSTTAYMSAGQAYVGKVWIYRFDTAQQKFVYHSVIFNPTVGNTTFGSSISWINDKLSISQAAGIVFTYELVGDRTWKIVSNTKMENATGASTLALDGNTVIQGKATSAGYPNITGSGAVRVQAFNGTSWASSRGVMAGADAEFFVGEDFSAGAGGAGYIGGKAGAVANASPGGASGGSNLVPAGGSETIAIGANRASTDVLALGAGASVNAGDGENARIVITVNGVATTYDFTGADQQLIIPAGITSIDFALWGAGGGAGNTSAWTARNSSFGGAGAKVSGTLTVVPGETLTLMVGAGGAGGPTNGALVSRANLRRYGMGGVGAISATANLNGGGSGGGLAGIFRDSTALAVAAGGGGGSVRPTSTINALNGMPGGLAVNQDPANSSAQFNDYDLIVAPGTINSRSAADYFGTSVAIIDDNNLVAGAPGHAFNTTGEPLPVQAGTVFEYQRVNGAWKLNKKLTSSKPTAGEGFGFNLALANGNLVVMGGLPATTINVEIATLAASQNTNTIETFIANGTDWTPIKKTATATEDSRALSLTWSNGIVVLGNPQRDTDGTKQTIVDAGGFETYDANLASLGSVVGDGFTSGRFAGDNFGSGVVVTPNQIIVGAPGHDFTQNGVSQRTDQGALFVFDKKNATHVFRSKLNLELDSTLTNYGQTLQLIGTNLYAGTSDTSKLVELSSDINGNWTISRHIEATVGKIASVVSKNKLVELDVTNGIGVGSQPTISGAGRAKSYTINSDATLTDLAQDYTIPGNSNGRNSGDNFGYSVYASNDFVVVGAPAHAFDIDGNTNTKSGALFVFNKTGSDWQREAKLVADSTAVTGYGRKLSGSNGWVITSGLTPTDGFARVFQRVAQGTWTPKHDFAGTGSNGDSYAASIAAADTTKFVLGIPSADSIPGVPVVVDSGAVETFERVGSDWFDRGYLSEQGLSRGRNGGDWFGYQIAINKNYLVVGSPKYSYDQLGGNETSSAGAIWIYLRTGSTYPLIGKFVSPSRVANGLFGASVAIDDVTNTIAVGETGTNSVHVFAFDGGDLTLTQTIASAEVGFGTSIGMGDELLAIGSPHAQTDKTGANTLVDAGAVYVYAYDASASNWALKEKIAGFTDTTGTLMANGRVAGDLFGSAVAVDTTGSLITGSPTHDFDKVGANQVDSAGAVFLKRI